MTTARGGLDMRKTANFLNRFWDDQSGAAAAEYVIILAIIGAALTFAMLLLSDAVATSINDTATCIDTRGVTCN
jgi:pilus assembly protein Flp/PilA